MKKVILLSAAIMALATAATAATITQEKPYDDEQVITVQKSYLDGVYTGNGWSSNWFVTAHGGLSAFIGKPVGHGDLFDRTTPMLHLNIGKWVTPTVGLRLAFEGFNFKDQNTQKHTMQNIHADLLYNISYLFKEDLSHQPTWNVMPLAGIGVIHNSFYGKKPVALTLGVNVGYRVSDRILISAEAANTVTWQDFDGIGNASRLGDNLLHASVGLSYTIGKSGWRQVVDPQPYILANDILNDRVKTLHQENECLKSQLPYSNEVTTDACQQAAYPKNNYRGLNELRTRMQSKNKGNSQEDPFVQVDGSTADATMFAQLNTRYDFSNQDAITTYPICYFFNINSIKLTDDNQALNIQEMAKAIKQFNLKAVVVGAADAATGTDQLNRRLAKRRAQFITRQLVRYGVPAADITTQSRGGISDYDNLPANRNCKVMLQRKEMPTNDLLTE